ncbi:MAG: DUF6816 family protein [Waterburya sp.]
MKDKLTFKHQLLLNTAVFLLINFIYLIFFSFNTSAIAATLENRILQFPQWDSKPEVQRAVGDLEYPEWMTGTWNVQSTLVEQIAPQAPDIVTPGFADNEKYLNQAISFQVRFGSEYYSPPSRKFLTFPPSKPLVVADRAFNGRKIAQAYLGDDNVYQVKIDPDNPNQQITFLRGERQLVAKITGRVREIPNEQELITTEITQQLFKSPTRIYLNEVEITSNYQLIDPNNISAEQITAIYLSPQDPDYFKAGDQPVALYRYHLDLTKQVKS